MMMLAHVLRDVLGGLPPEVEQLVRARVRFFARPWPTPTDLERGAEADMAGYFYGHPVGAEDDDAGELELEEGDDIAVAPAAAPGGEIVIFTRNIAPLTEDNVREVLLHEIAHFLGDSESDVLEAGLADDDDDQVVEVDEC